MRGHACPDQTHRDEQDMGTRVEVKGGLMDYWATDDTIESRINAGTGLRLQVRRTRTIRLP